MAYKLTLDNHSFFNYNLIQSARAQYIRIKILPTGEVNVVIPQRIKNQLAHDFVKERKDWIKKALDQIKQHPIIEVKRPKQLNLRLIKENWKTNYFPTDYQGVTLTSDTIKKSLLLEGMTDEKEIIFNVLEQWLKNKAKLTFPSILNEIANEHGFNYNRVTIRGQKTRWGSCSSKQNINLNYKLLFFPEKVVRYVFIHELCHTLEMNHSKQFWDLVKRYDPNYQQHRQILKEDDHYVPAGL